MNYVRMSRALLIMSSPILYCHYSADASWDFFLCVLFRTHENLHAPCSSGGGRPGDLTGCFGFAVLSATALAVKPTASLLSLPQPTSWPVTLLLLSQHPWDLQDPCPTKWWNNILSMGSARLNALSPTLWGETQSGLNSRGHWIGSTCRLLYWVLIIKS